MYLYSDVTESDLRVWSEDPDRLCFGRGGPIVRTPSQLLFVRAIDVAGGVAVACGKLSLGNGTYVCNSLGAQRQIGENFGNHAHGLFAAGAGEVGVVWVQVEAGVVVWKTAIVNARTLETVRVQKELNGPIVELVTTTVCAGSFTQGFNDYFPNEPEPRWTHLNRYADFAGFGLYYPITRGDFTVGLSDRFYGVGVHQHSTGTHFIAWQGGDTQVHAHVNARGTVAVSAAGTPETLFVTPDRFLPYVVPIEPPPPPPPPDPPDPPEPPEGPPVPTEPASLETMLRDEERPKFPALMSADECVEMLRRTAKRGGPKWGLLKKDSGNFGTLADGRRCSVDHLTYDFGTEVRGIDVLGSAGSVDGKGPSTPQWGKVSEGEIFPRDRFVDVSQTSEVPGGPPPPDPGGPPPAPVVDLAPLLSKVAALATTVAELNARLDQRDEAFRQQLGQIKVTLGLIEQQIGAPAIEWPTYTGTVRVLGMTSTITLKPQPPPTT